jgi:rhamnose transport system ATP-binding protein
VNDAGPSEPLLRLKDICKSFGAVCALKEVSFELFGGEVHALVGENGAGKSTLVRIITGALKPDRGVVAFRGQPVHHLNPARMRKLGIACIYQQPSLFPDLSVAENLLFRLDAPGPRHRIRWPEVRARARELLGRVGALISPDTEIRQLSMPEQQLVEIACAIGSGARVILMDEPTASLTQKEQHLLFSVVRSLRQNGAGILYISHRLEEIFSLADRVTVLRDGNSLGTNPIGNVTEASLIRLMVGRDLARSVCASNTLGKAVLSLRSLGCSSSGVQGVNLNVHAGEIVGLAGLVGAGRTELARVIFGITPADSGEILLNGQAITVGSSAEAIANGIAYLPEDRRRHGIILEMTIAQNISMAVHNRLFPGAWLRQKPEHRLASSYMRDLGIKATGTEARGNSLSGGNQQKVALARWLATHPKLLLLDEPTQGVDIATKTDIHSMIRDLANRGVAVLLISSDLPEVLTLSDRIAVMRGGRLIRVLPSGTEAREVMACALGRELVTP